jgi:protein-S-isoprenylcysteine O-methyltransferase Ste14
MDRGNLFRVWLPSVFGFTATALVYWQSPEPADPLSIAGFILMLLGLFGVMLSRYTLGRSFSVRAKATALVTSGIYSRIRNPIYLSGGVFFVGIVLLTRLPVLWSLLAVMVPVQMMRARREARVLEEKFGEAYRRYRAQTWF